MTRQVSTGPYFITTAPEATLCHRCRRSVLAATIDGLDHRVDVEPLTLPGELAALLAGRATFDLRGEHLYRRTTSRITSGQRLTVLAEHSCAPTPPEYVDQAHLQAAVHVVGVLLGAQVVIDTTGTPPY